MAHRALHAYEAELLVPVEYLELPLQGMEQIAWLDHLLNPRRLRGSDFLMRWAQGRWSEDRLIQAVEETRKYMAILYGPSSVAPDRSDPRAHEVYFERLERAGLGRLKRPDLLVFLAEDRKTVENLVDKLGGSEELPFTREDDPCMAQLLRMAVVAIECENSLWRGKKMPDYGAELRPMRRLGGKLGLPKNAVLPTVIIKEEDKEPLLRWQEETGVSIHIWHLFFDLAFGLGLDEAVRLITEGSVSETQQVFQAPGGATTRKAIYKIPYHFAYLLGETVTEPTLRADSIEDRSGHILPYVQFEGGQLRLLSSALDTLHALAQEVPR